MEIARKIADGFNSGGFNTEGWIIGIMALGAAFALFPDKLTLDDSDKYREHLRLLLAITINRGSMLWVNIFIVLSVLAGLGTFALLIARISFRLSILSMLVVMALPYVVLRAKLQRIRVESSREGEMLITELLNNYKIHFYNMREAIDRTALTIEDAPESKRLLFNLSKGLQRAGTEREIKRLLDEFKLSINTSWGNILAANMEFALSTGIRVSDAIKELADTVSKARKLEEYSRRENNESRLMLKYVAPASYILTIFAAIYYFNMTPAKFIYYQFRTEVGLTWFIISLLVYVTGLMVQSFVSKSRLDF